MTALTMKQCREITDWIIDTTGKDGGQPVAIAICDGEGFLLSLVKMDEVPTKSVHFAQHKAYTAARMQTATDAFLVRLQREQLDIQYFCDPKLAALPGGAPIYAPSGKLVGSVGISGRPSQEDQELANAAAQRILF
ncbi:GlcG/HbpS family heme-binding protein [Anaerospora hongkongensis]|uniref:GlcG/HbpS family heme-binding protein n=1 Tax=Anaerospora hongkongensis TaxID=244830 RepID=UPI00289D290F|nr:heme-binding protein [Anaerospora hongkongensis]